MIFFAFIFRPIYHKKSGSVSRQPNNWLYRTRLDRVSATNLCYVIFISYLLSCITFHFRQVMQDNYLRTRSLRSLACGGRLRRGYNPLRASLHTLICCPSENTYSKYFLMGTQGLHTFLEFMSKSGFCTGKIIKLFQFQQLRNLVGCVNLRNLYMESLLSDFLSIYYSKNYIFEIPFL